jgi:predicted MFS family arabinose efflux permease
MLSAPSRRPVAVWAGIVLASLILSITMGIRQTVGLFVHPIIADTGMTIAEVSMALAVGQLLWGAFQPVCGAWADKKGALPVLCCGAVCLAAGQLLTVRADTPLLLLLAQGVLSPAGAAAGSFPVLFGIVTSRLSPDKRSMAGGIINAGGSIGQFAFAPLVQGVMNARNASLSLLVLAGAALATILPSWALCRKTPGAPARAAPEKAARAAPPAGISLREQLGAALRTPSYLLLHAGFFTCGFHVAFLTTHLPSEVSMCGHTASVAAASLSLIGLCNIAGSIGIGFLGKYFRMKYLLSGLYASRAAMILVYLASPKTELTFYLFSAAIGCTWLATVAPTAGIVGKLFGMRYLATLFGLTLFTHQIGGFLGAWTGGLALQNAGSLLWIWQADAALALAAAFVHLPIQEPSPRAARALPEE